MQTPHIKACASLKSGQSQVKFSFMYSAGYWYTCSFIYFFSRPSNFDSAPRPFLIYPESCENPSRGVLLLSDAPAGFLRKTGGAAKQYCSRSTVLSTGAKDEWLHKTKHERARQHTAITVCSILEHICHSEWNGLSCRWTPKCNMSKTITSTVLDTPQTPSPI